MSEIEYDPSGKSSLPFQVGAEIFESIVVEFRFYVFPFVINAQIS